MIGSFPLIRSFSLYGLLIGLGFSVFWILFESAISPELNKQAKKSSPSGQFHLSFALILIAFTALIGARIYHLWTDWDLYADQSWFTWIAVWQGGLGIFGALLGGFLGFSLWKHFFAPRVSWLLALDAAAIGIPIGQAIGRWGNYFNKELFGLPTSLPWGITIPFGLRPDAYLEFSTFHPLFLYESLALLAIGVFLIVIWKRFSSLFPLGTGWYFGCYLFAYGSIRACLELLRPESAPGWLGLSIAQWISLFLSVIGAVLFSRAFRLQWSEDASDSLSATNTPAHSTLAETPVAADVPLQHRKHAARGVTKRRSRAKR